MEKNKTHIVCLDCVKSCKQPFSWWSGMMPPTIYCEDFVMKKKQPFDIEEVYQKIGRM